MTPAELIAEARTAVVWISRDAMQNLVQRLINALEAATRPLPDGEAARLTMPASETLRCKQCGGIAEEARRIYATPVCFKCLPPPPPLKHQEIRRPSTSAELIAEARKLSDSLFCGNSLVRELANALEAATRPLPDGEAARSPMPASEPLRCKQCGGVAEEARRIYATPVCFKCLPPPAPLKRQAACGPPKHHAFDIDIYDCPCGHMYGDHEYHCVERKIVIDRCVSCEEVSHG